MNYQYFNEFFTCKIMAMYLIRWLIICQGLEHMEERTARLGPEHFKYRLEA